jgi:hypothetical protein
LNTNAHTVKSLTRAAIARFNCASERLLIKPTLPAQAAEVIALIDSLAVGWSATELALAVSAGNRNAKAPLHFAGQISRGH